MTFYCGFSDLSGKKYDIEIHSDNGDASEINIMMGSTPLTISSSSSGLLSPIKSRSATINVVTKEWYMELYEPVSRGTWVKVYETENVNNVIFFGWLTPCSYDQTWTYMDTITLEAVDALSSCKDYKWVHNYRYNNFQEIVLSILKSAGYKGNLYVPQTYSYDFDELLASSGNFIDDDEAHTPWTEYEVLEEICKFMGWSMIPHGHDVWIVDYKAESVGSVTYNKYSILDSSLVGTYSSSSATEITLSNEAGGTANISIDDIFNKVEISDNLYKIDEIAPDIFDDGLHTSVTEEKNMGADQSKWTSVRRRRFLWWEWDSGKDKDRLTGTDYQTICRLNPSSGWTHRFYRHSDLYELDNSDGQGYYDETTAADSRQTPYTNSAVNRYCNTHGCLLQHYAYVDESHPNNVPATIDWTDILTFFVLGPTSQGYYFTNQAGSILDLQKDVLEYNINEEIQWKPSSGTTWLTIKGDLFYQNSAYYKDGKKKKKLTIVNLDESWYSTCPVDKSLSSLPTDLYYLDASRKESDSNYGNGFKMWRMKLQIGEGNNARWWNSETEKWQSTECYFYLSYNNNPDNEGDEFVPSFQWISTVNNKNFKDKVGVDAYAIPIPSDSDDPFRTYGDAPSRGKFKLTICTPALCAPECISQYEAIWGRIPLGFGVFAPVIYCKDFEIGVVYTDTDVWYNSHDDKSNKDKVYVGYINETFKQDFDGLQLKLNTSIQDKPISKSYVSTSDGAYLDKIQHSTRSEAKVQEYNLIDLYLDHHSERKPILDINLHGLFTPETKFTKSNVSDDVYMIDSYDYDVAKNNNRIKLIAF